MFRPSYSCSQPLEVLVTLRLKRQLHLQKSLPKKFSVSLHVKYVAATRAQLSAINYQLILHGITSKQPANVKDRDLTSLFFPPTGDLDFTSPKTDF
jgi:hypothetical protein